MDVNNENTNKLLDEANNTVRANVAGCVEMFQKITWKKVKFTVPMVPSPAKRPRLCGNRIYVPGAAKNAAFFNKIVLPTLKDLYVDTPCKLDLDTYVPTPKSFTRTQKILAEMKIIRPWNNIGDVDNYLKSGMDMLQPNEKRGHVGILEDDCLVLESTTRKYYSQTPRYEITITFMNKIPKTLLHVLRLDRNA